MPFANDLLEQARHLANREPKRPKQASLRRAISTAYYALFHLLTGAAVKNWKIVSQRAALARAFEHSRMNQACRSTQKKQFVRSQQTNAQHLKSIAATFMQLQQQRHLADYDNSKKWSRTEVLTHIDAVASAFNSWSIVSTDAMAAEFLLLLLVPER